VTKVIFDNNNNNSKNIRLNRRGRQMCDGFLNKKRVVAPTAHNTHINTTLKGNARTLVNLQEKKWWVSRLKVFKNTITKNVTVSNAFSFFQ
jgi:hypothetical protein